MALNISVPDSANTSQTVTLGGLDYIFTFSYNSRDERYRLSISLNGVSVVRGLKLIESTSPTFKYDLVDFDHGQLALVAQENTSKEAGRYNIGLSRAYNLIYLTNEELSS